MAVTQFTVPNKNGSYDGGMVIKHFTTLNIAAGGTVTTDQPCRGLLIYVQGDCTISGTLSMTARGASTPNISSEVTADYSNNIGLFYPYLPTSGTPAAISGLNSLGYFFRGTESAGNNNIDSRLSSVSLPINTFNIVSIYRTGATGGAAIACAAGSTVGNVGTSGSTGQSGGGGTGARTTGGMYSGVERGGIGTCFSGGSGSGGSAHSGPNSTQCLYPGLQGSDTGGSGGVATSYYGTVSGNGHTAGGGAGNPGGSRSSVGGPFDPANSSYAQGTAVGNSVAGQSNGSSGTGGLLILIVGGNLTINSGGIIESKGSAGGSTGLAASGASDSSGGGGSGGGNIIILHRGTYTNNGTVTSAGGAGGAVLSWSGAAGGAGGAGSIQVIQIK